MCCLAKNKALDAYYHLARGFLVTESAHGFQELRCLTFGETLLCLACIESEARKTGKFPFGLGQSGIFCPLKKHAITMRKVTLIFNGVTSIAELLLSDKVSKAIADSLRRVMKVN